MKQNSQENEYMHITNKNICHLRTVFRRKKKTGKPRRSPVFHDILHGERKRRKNRPAKQLKKKKKKIKKIAKELCKDRRHGPTHKEISAK